MSKPQSSNAARRTQAERSAITRQVLLDAAIKCLFEHGYGATTTMLVAKTAGVSRGAMLHQFPTKNDLMIFVVNAVFDEEMALYAELLDGIDDPRERLVAYPEAAWKILSQPAGVAVQEILQGSRSDVELARELKPVQAHVEATARKRLRDEFPEGASPELFHLIVSAARGLSIYQVLAEDRVDVSGSIRMLQTLIRAGLQTKAISPASGAGDGETDT